MLATTGAGRRTQAARQRKSLANYQKFRETLKPGGASFSTHYKEDTIILDIGGRYITIFVFIYLILKCIDYFI